MSMYIFPSSGTDNNSTFDKDIKIDFNGGINVLVNAAYNYKKASVSSVGAYNVIITPKYVYATAKCSCSLYTDYKYHTRVFENYDPSSSRWGVLKFEIGSGKNNPEGMWYSSVTDMDWCLVHGKSHDGRGVYLTPYKGTINGKKIVNGYFV